MIHLEILYPAAKSDEALFGLFVPLAILIVILWAIKPFKKRDKSIKDANEDMYSQSLRIRGYIGLIALIFAAVLGIYKGIVYFFLR